MIGRNETVTFVCENAARKQHHIALIEGLLEDLRSKSAIKKEVLQQKNVKTVDNTTKYPSK